MSKTIAIIEIREAPSDSGIYLAYHAVVQQSFAVLMSSQKKREKIFSTMRQVVMKATATPLQALQPVPVSCYMQDTPAADSDATIEAFSNELADILDDTLPVDARKRALAEMQNHYGELPIFQALAERLNTPKRKKSERAKPIPQG